MKVNKLTSKEIENFKVYLHQEEKSGATQEKYLRDVRAFCVYAAGATITKDTVMGWKKQLLQDGYAVRSINSMLASVNSLLAFLGYVFFDFSRLWVPGDYAPTSGLIPVCVLAVSAVVMLLCGLLMKKFKWQWVSDYALPISLLAGMASAIPITAWLS